MTRSWMIRRAGLAIALMVGFYAMALAIALGLLWIPYAEWRYAERVHPRVALFAIVSAGAVLWALLPRIDRFEAPGPRLDEREHPRLFDLINDTAAKTNQTLPTDVYLVNDVNAFVTHRGGVMGFGSHRVMGVGLPLLQTLSVLEFKSVIAHEFGHYAAGDVSLGPWIYKTRAAIGRTVQGLEESIVQKPFVWYASLFLKLTHSVSRQQEFIADQTAAKVAGVGPTASALRRVTAGAAGYNGYFQTEVVPVLRAGFLPPVAAGFGDFLNEKNVADALDRVVTEAESGEHTDVYDTHPSLSDRLAALPAGDTRDDSGPAVALLGDAEKYTRVLLAGMFGREAIDQLKPIQWSTVGQSVYAAQWQSIVARYSTALRGLTLESVPSTPHEFAKLGGRLIEAGQEMPEAGVLIPRAAYVVAAALAARLLSAGWQPLTRPGRPVLLARNGETFDPFGTVRRLSTSELSREQWLAECRGLGLPNEPLLTGNGVAAI